MTDSGSPDQGASPFSDLDAYIALPRSSGLALSPDGTRLITSVATLDAKKTRYVNALWEVDPAGDRPARRLTRSAKGESGAAFLPDGSVLFVSGRPDPEAADADEEKPALWQLPTGGEARVIATRPGGVAGVVVARAAGTVLVSSGTLPGAVSGEDDEKRRKERKDLKVSAILHESYPVRYWDHDLGPDLPRLLAGAAPAGESDPGQPAPRVTLADITPDAGRGLADGDFDYDITPDGRSVLCQWALPERGGSRAGLVVIDVASGARRVLLGDPEREYFAPRVSPDGRSVAVPTGIREQTATAPDTILTIVDLASGESRELATGWDRWPGRPVWTPDGSALIVAADEGGAAPLFRVDVTTGEVVRLTGDRGAYSDPQVSPDGSQVYALRAAIDAPAAPVRLDASAPDQQPVLLRRPPRLRCCPAR